MNENAKKMEEKQRQVQQLEEELGRQSRPGEASLPRNIAELRAFNENIYDIEGHRVMALGGGIITIDIDGVAFDQLECDRLRRLGETKDTKEGGSEASSRASIARPKTNKFLIHLPPK